MIRRPPRSTLDRSSAASDVYKRQAQDADRPAVEMSVAADERRAIVGLELQEARAIDPVSYTHLRAHETVLDLVCRLLLEKKNLLYHTHQTRQTKQQETPTTIQS